MKPMAKNNPKSPSTYTKNLDNIKLLFSDDEFKEIIKEIRDKLKIYQGEFSKNPDSFKAWYDNLIKESDEISLSKEFILEEKEIKKNLKDKKINKKEARKQMSLLYKRVPINYLSYKIELEGTPNFRHSLRININNV